MRGNQPMNYHILKLNLDNLPWAECSDADLLKVKNLRIPRVVDDRYAEDINYGLYTGDDENAYFHARSICNKLNSLRCEEKSEDIVQQIAELQNILLKDIENYLQACSCLLIENRKRIKTLIMLAGELCCNEKLLKFVQNYWEEVRDYRKENSRETDYSPYDNVWLDFPELYTAMGDKLLYEEHNIDLAIEFYQLALLEWGEKSSNDTDALQKQIADCKHIRNKKYFRMSFESDAPVLKEIYRHFGNYYRMQRASMEDVNRAVEEAEAFAELFALILKDTFYSKDMEAEFKIRNRADFRLCYMMALLIYNDAFLWGVFCLMQDTEMEQEVNKENIIRGLQFNCTEYLQPVRDYWSDTVRVREEERYQNLLLLLRETAYVELIQVLLREKNPKQDIAYYTSLNTLRYMLPERAKEKAGRLSIMHVAYMNDPNEGKTLWNYCGGKSLASTLSGQRRSAEYPFVFLKCFTPLIDDLPMWEMYGDHAAGCCIIFKKAFLRSSRLQVPLYRVCYLRKKNTGYVFCAEDNPGVENKELLQEYLFRLQEVYKECKKDNIRPYFKKITEPVIFLFKDANYQHEQELRIMYRYANISEDFLHIEGEYPKLYLNPEIYLRMQEIILGPKVQDIGAKVPYLQEELEKMSRMLGIERPVVSVSEIEYQ